jgi:acetyl esterase/lipase
VELSPTVSYTGTLVAPPARARTAIKLSGRVQNPTPEEWETRVERPFQPGASGTGKGELWARNVSEPTLEPFLPDASKATGAAMIIAPGGAFVELSMEREGYLVAKWLNEQGVAAFVLKYRLAPTPADPQQAAQKLLDWARARVIPSLGTTIDPLTEEQRQARSESVESGMEAVRYVRTHADEFHISPNRIGFMGFSAGAVTVVGVALKAEGASKPDLVAPIYGALPDDSALPSTAPPAFVLAAADDVLLPGSLAVYTLWRTSKVPAELHVVESGGHGFGMQHRGTRSDHWTELFAGWLGSHGFLTTERLARNP